eukprot:TRINITY_DN71988_c0_g1_i1.p1 TRINITY_DN71988_c0_g1~~TRINITY_DN71988_c0_g1_i1.p1  ORF type:complete len:195 (+),score=41.75 TRINITY_DN71988_c0_g1_i1:168-752(+)
MGSGSSVFSRGSAYAVKPVHGRQICNDESLQQLLQGWMELGVSFSGAMLMAEGKDSTEVYDKEKNTWSTMETFIGEVSLVLRTTGDGWLHFRLLPSGFRWEHVGSYRGLGKSDKKAPQFKMVESSTARFGVDDLIDRLYDQSDRKYQDGTDVPLSLFAKFMFKALTHAQAEGEKPNNRAKAAVQFHEKMQKKGT